MDKTDYKTDYKTKDESGHLAGTVSYPKLNLLEAARFKYLSDILGLVKNIEGDIVECGVGWGWSFLYFALLSRLENNGRHLWGFDSFQGFPEPSDEDKSLRNPKKGEWKTDLNSVYKLLEESGLDKQFIRYQVTLVEGFFEKTLDNYAGEKIAVLHADADLYQSYKTIYDMLFEKVVPGGIILFDEYMNTFEFNKWPGAKKAIDETFLKHCELCRDKTSGKYFAVKK